MALLLGLLPGLLFGFLSSRAGRVRGIVLACVPVVAWWILVVSVRHDGITDTESSLLGLSLVGVILGLLLGAAVPALRRRSLTRP